jgi:hypothetical protein
MFSIVKSWKEFRVHLPSLDAWLRATAGEAYKGNSADSVLTLWFEEEPSAEILAAIDAQWDSLTEVGEAAKWQLDTDREAAVEAAKVSLLTAAFDSLIPAERKLLLGMTLSNEDKDALIVKQGA